MGYGYQAIVGHTDEIAVLQKAVESDWVSHAYLFTGEEGMGKRTLADAFALALVCEQKDGRACLSCTACKKAIDHNHPDIIYVTHEKPNVLTVDDIREQVVNTVDIRPYEGGRKIYIIADAEKMNPQAQNSLLKTIEEPPEYAVIVLLSKSPEALLPTIRSRCVSLALKSVPDHLVEEYLQRELELPDYEARVLTAFAQGSVGRARAAATDPAFSEIREKSIQLVKRVHGMETAAILELTRDLKEDKEHIEHYLDIFILWFRDVLYYKATKDVDSLIFTNEISSIREQASGSSYEGLQLILEAVDKCRVRLHANVNFELALELLLMTIKENCNA